MSESKAESLRSSIQSDKAEQLRENISNNDTTQYSPAVMQNKALIMYAEDDIDSLFDVEKGHIPYIAYLRALNEKIPIPGTIKFLHAQLSLSRSIDRQGRKEFGQALNRQPVVLPGQGVNLQSLMQQPDQKEGILHRLFKKKKIARSEHELY